MGIKRLTTLLLFIIPLMSNALSLRPDSPNEYLVKPGDTLWEIASRFLCNPWEWKELLDANPQIKNPHKLYPGAIIYLHKGLDKPYLTVLSNGTVRLSPKARPVKIGPPIPAIPLADIKPFFNGSIVLDQDVLSTAPYVVAYAGEHLVGGQDNEIYVKGIEQFPPEIDSFAIYRPDGIYVDPNSDEFLGYKTQLIGHANVIKRDLPATMKIADITRGVHLKDKLLPNDYPPYELYFLPQAPPLLIEAKIIDLLGGLTQIARGQVVVINKGAESGLMPGFVLAIHQRGKIIKDPLNKEQLIRLPQERIGEIMLFRIFTKTSFGLIMRSTRAIRKSDTVTNP